MNSETLSWPRRLHIGTSGWSYAHWRGVLYPEKLPSGEWLSHYAENFETVELNASFYRLQPRSVFEGWAAKVPPGFVMAAKASRFITHVKRLADVENPLKTFLERVSGLGDHLGPILFQLPPGLEKDLGRLTALLELLPHDQRFAFEFRSPTWFEDDVYQALSGAGAALCIADSPRFPVAREVTAPFTYLRLHGGQELYESEYSLRELKKWGETTGEYLSRGIECFVYFNNDAHGFAVKNARELKDILGNKVRAA